MYPEIRLLHATLSSYVVLYAAAVGAVAWLARAELRRKGYPPWLWLRLALAGLLGAFVGSKLYFFVVARDAVIFRSPRTYWDLSGTGWYGALLGGGLAVAATLWRARVPLVAAFDTIVPAVPVGQVLGRLGCFLAGCCAGRPADVPWAVAFPEDPALAVHPAQLYESLALAGVAAVLWWRRRLDSPAGTQTGAYLVLAGASRFVVEFFRLNPRVALFLTIPQLAATFEAGLGLLLLRAARRPAGTGPE
jgi:phosphatidylglycerol:prolipoprotein diacylglycerol transferase